MDAIGSHLAQAIAQALQAADAMQQVASEAANTLNTGERIAGAAAVVNGEVKRLKQTVTRFSGQVTS